MFLICGCSFTQLCPTLRPHGRQHASLKDRLPCPTLSPGVCSNSCPLSRWCHPTISSSATPFSPFAFNHSQHQGLLQWVSSLHQVAKVLELQLQIYGYLLSSQTPPESGSWFPRAIHSTEELLKVVNLFVNQNISPYKFQVSVLDLLSSSICKTSK